MQIEMFDVYTRDRKPTGRVIARGEREPQGFCRLIVHVCIFDTDKRRMLIQRRQPWKKSYAGMWDITVSGSVKAGEGSREAIMREISEEIGLDLSSDEVRLVQTMYGAGRIDDVYIAVKDADIDSLSLQYDEVAEVRWATLDEIFALQDAGEFVGYRPEQLKLYFALADGRGSVLN